MLYLLGRKDQMAIRCNSRSRLLWLLPPTAQGFHESHCGYKLLATVLHSGPLQTEAVVLRGGDFEICDQPVTITLVGNLQLAVGRDQSVALLVVLTGEEILCREVVFDFGKCGQHRLTIASDSLVISRPGKPQPATQLSALEDGQR